MGPVLTFSLVVGLALDCKCSKNLHLKQVIYNVTDDIFLTSRVRELRLEGYDNTAAVIKGFYHSGQSNVSCPRH